ncbi:hypothetical protein HQ560_04835 [bacterium]|nr:hypothetical protein [bacterium]
MTPTESLPPDEDPLADWSSTLFVADRAQYILIANTVTLYSVVMFGRGITDGNRFLQMGTDTIGEVLRDDGLGAVFDSRVAPAAAQVRFSKALNRSVIGSMNDLVCNAKFHLAERDLSPYDTSLLLNGIPMGALDYVQPREAFRQMFEA